MLRTGSPFEQEPAPPAPLGSPPSTQPGHRDTVDPSSGGQFGNWVWDLADDGIEFTGHAHHLSGGEPVVRLSREKALALVYPDDRPGLTAKLDDAQRTRRPFSHEFRVIRQDGTVRVVEAHGNVVVDVAGRPVRLHGTLQDVTDHRRVQVELQNLATVLDTSDDAITTCSLDGVFLTWNRGAEKLYGYTAEEAIGQPLDLIIPVGERAQDHVNWERLLNDEPVRSLETVRTTKDGRRVIVSVTRSLIVDAQQHVIAVASVGRDITESKRAQSLLATAHAEAVAASETKSRFLANMSHEIRTPMNGVIGMTEILLDTDLTDEQRAYAEQIARSGEDMMRIINDILDVSKIEAGQLQLDARDFDLRQVIEHACSAGSPDALAKGLALEVVISDELPGVAHGDDGRLRQVILNLVSNAIKFTASGSVRVLARPAGGARVRIEVKDTGIGIDPEALDRMFEPFTQADASTTRRYGGTGLGLAIARELVELMDGTIGAFSEPGRGSTFWFELDLGAEARTQPHGEGETDKARASSEAEGIAA
jgi:PAS domain S-box-containing protein